MPRILHLLPANPRVAGYIADYFAGYPDAAVEFFIGLRTGETLAGLEALAGRPDFASGRYDSPALRRRLADLGRGDALVVHYLTHPAARAMRAVAPGVRVAWALFGAEFYARYAISRRPDLLPATERALLRGVGWAERGRVRAGASGRPSLLDRINPRALRRNRVILAAMRRVDIIATAFPTEFALIRDRAGSEAEFAEFTYYNIEQTAAQALTAPARGDVLVGNNSHPSNNHLDALALLPAGCGHAVLPLAYGDALYRDRLVAALDGRAPEGLRLLTEPMPLTDYLELLGGCSAAVFAHRRQQAFGNVIALVYQGSRVWLRPENPIGDLLTTLGVEFGMLGDAPLTCEDLRALSPAARARNRELLRAHFDPTRVVALAHALQDRLLNSSACA